MVELIVVLAIVALVLGFSVPWFAQLSSGHRLKSATRELTGVLQTARSYAIALGQVHAVVFDAPAEASGDAWTRYHLEDASGRIVEKPFALPPGVSFAAPAGQGEAITFDKHRVAFTSTGAGSESGSIWLSGGRDRYSRVAVSEATGRIRVESVP